MCIRDSPHTVHRGGVADILDIGLADVRFTHEVDEHLCSFLVLTGGGDGHAVHRQHRPLLREHPGQVGVAALRSCILRPCVYGFETLRYRNVLCRPWQTAGVPA